MRDVSLSTMDDELKLTLVRGHRWAALIDHLAKELTAHLTDPFAAARVIVGSAATGRIVGQAVARRMGISAGISYVSPSAFLRDLSLSAGVERDRARWIGTPLTLAVADALSEVAADHPILERSLRSDEDRPGRRLATAARLARLFRTYLDSTPSLVANWMDGIDVTPAGQALPDHLAWQPELLRASVEHLEVDPIDLLDQLEAAAAADRTPTFLLAVDELTLPQQRMLRALASGAGLTAIHPIGSPGEEWAAALARTVVEVGDSPAPTPEVEVHDSHGDSRQVEVLRDELTRAFADDQTLEPRDVIIVTPQPDRYAPLLDAAFADTGPAGHPGRRLRVQVSSTDQVNAVTDLALQLLRLPDSRATASELLGLLLSPPIAHRWHLDDRHALAELVAGAGIRWGLDSAHRLAFGLGDLSQNTWLRGIDRLLIALASGPTDDIGLDLSGAEAVTSSDLNLVGSLCELLSRLRRLVAEIATPASVTQWAGRLRRALDELVGLPRADEWQRWQAQSLLARLEADHGPRVLTRQEFVLLLAEAVAPWRSRVAAGNGALQVVPLGELLHVEHRVVALLGVTDDVVPGRSRIPADSVDLDGALPDQAERRLRHLHTHALAAERLLIVRQARSQRTNGETATPVAISWLLTQLGVTPDPFDHPPMASSAAAFGPRPSFDQAAYAGALARHTDPQPSSQLTNRLEARTRPLSGPLPVQVQLESLITFLQDPARAFLRAAAGITQYGEPSVSDEMTLVTSGLVHWGVVQALLASLQENTPLADVEKSVSQREQLPPGMLGLRAFQKAKDETVSLWMKAEADWKADVADHPIDQTITLTHPELGYDVTLVGTVRTRGGAVVEVTPSKGPDKIIAPWVRSLALAATGVPTSVRLHQLVKEYGTVTGETRTVEAPEQEAAAQQLATLLAAYVLGQHRLIPAPATSSLAYAEQAVSNRFNPARWQGPLSDWRTPHWTQSASWPLFFNGDLSELFSDALVPSDPPIAGSAFEAWALALYGPLARSKR